MLISPDRKPLAMSPSPLPLEPLHDDDEAQAIETSRVRMLESLAHQSALESVHESLMRMGLADDATPVRIKAITTSSSSDLYRVDIGEPPQQRICVKRALSRLRGGRRLAAPIERNHYEILWLIEANRIVPNFVPDIVGVDSRTMMFAMSWLDPASHRPWSALLADGEPDLAFAGQVAIAVARMHAATARRGDLAGRFASNDIFRQMRIDPLLRALSHDWPGHAARIEDIAARTHETRVALIHGDVNPGNVLRDPRGRPMLLDAEFACYGDPAFDAAYALAHLLLASLALPGRHEASLLAFDAFATTYLGGVNWENQWGIEERILDLLPLLLLSRVDSDAPGMEKIEATTAAALREAAAALADAGCETLDQASPAWAAAVAATGWMPGPALPPAAFLAAEGP